MKLIVRAASFSAAIILAGCASGGVKVEEQQLARFEKGQTTYAQVVGQLGPPTSTTLMSDGKRLIVYSYVQAQARPESFIPIVGVFVGGADARSNLVSMIFTRDGVLESYSSTASQVGMGTGFESGNGVDARVSDQPRITSDPPRAKRISAPQGQTATTSSAGKTCSHDELVQARIARMNGYTSGPNCANAP